MAETVHPSGRTDGLDATTCQPAHSLRHLHEHRSRGTTERRTNSPRIRQDVRRRLCMTAHPADTGDQPAPSRHPQTPDIFR